MLWFGFSALSILMIVAAWDSLNSPMSLNNKFIQHHEKLLKDWSNDTQSPADCWICTYSPVSATSIPFLVIPVPPEELFAWTNCSDTLANNATNNVKLWNMTVGIPIVGWVGYPWWQGNLSGSSTHLQYLAYKGGVWVPRNRTQLTYLGQVPTYGLQVSFNVTSHSTDAFKPMLLERRLHNMSWEYSNLFPQGTNETCIEVPGNMPCNESSGYEKGTSPCGNPDAGYCSPLGQSPPWCMLQNASAFIDLVHRLVLQHSALWDLPSDMFWVCGDNAYKWLPVGVRGACTLGRLTPATFVIPNDQLNTQSIPKHTLYKRAADNTPRLSGRPHIVQMSVANKIVSSIFIYPMITQMWDKLVRATDYLDDQIWDILDILNTTVAVQNQLIIVTNQHTIVLDYLTAAQGGMCQVIGPACCHYIDPNSTIKLKLKKEDVQRLRDQYDKDNDRTKDSWWSDTFSFLNPANWFKGIGGWIAGIILSLLRIAVCLLIIYVLLKLVFWCISVCKKRCRNR
ncbi:uncharacterized protein [Dendrobates tinctorius]|uniref:uncharacterized protein n=1 Tax=Dendrobates tinctorius TaxID=92724 RepID=UPI003CC99521